MISAPELSRRSGASYRQIDYWTRLGYLKFRNYRQGRALDQRPVDHMRSGMERRYVDSELNVAIALMHLSRLGMLAGARRPNEALEFVPDFVDYVRRHGLSGEYEVNGWVTFDLEHIPKGN